MNIMLLSVSVWSGADAETRHAFHWISAALALPALVYSGRVFFRSAWARAAAAGAPTWTCRSRSASCSPSALSLYDTLQHGAHAYFDAATSLLFFLLIGRTLDHVMREKARAAVRGLVRLAPRGATVLRADGSRDYLPVDEIEPGMRLAARRRRARAGRRQRCRRRVRPRLLAGHRRKRAAAASRRASAVQAGTLNLTGAADGRGDRARGKAPSSPRWCA